MTRQVFVKKVDTKNSVIEFREGKQTLYYLYVESIDADRLEFKVLETKWLDGQDIDYPGLMIGD